MPESITRQGAQSCAWLLTVVEMVMTPFRAFPTSKADTA